MRQLQIDCHAGLKLSSENSDKYNVMVRNYWLFLLGLLFLTGCRVSGDIEDLAVKAADFKLTEIIVNAQGVADNATKLPVLVILKNSDGSFVPNFTPHFRIVAGAGVTFVSCQKSNAQGRSTCYFRASKPGTKTVRLDNINFNLDADLWFEPNTGSLGFQILSSSEQNGDASGYKVSTSVGNIHGSIKTEVGGWKIYSSVQGNIESIK